MKIKEQIIYLERSIFKMQSDEFVKPLKKKKISISSEDSKIPSPEK